MCHEWSNDKLKHNVLSVFTEFSSYHETLKEKIARNGILEEDSADSTFAPLTVSIPTDTHLPGYKRIFCLLGCIFSVSIAIVVGYLV